MCTVVPGTALRGLSVGPIKTQVHALVFTAVIEEQLSEIHQILKTKHNKAYRLMVQVRSRAYVVVKAGDIYATGLQTITAVSARWTFGTPGEKKHFE